MAALIRESERERQASAYERVAELLDACGAHDLAGPWREAADALLAAELAGLAEAA